MRRVWVFAVASALLGGEALAAEKLIVMPVVAPDSRLSSQAAVLSEFVLTELSNTQRFEVLGQSDITAVIGLERQKQLLGCTDESTSCLAEISGALGARYLFSANLGLLGRSYRMDMKLIDTTSGKAVARQGAVVDSEEVLLPEAKRLVERVMVQFSGGQVSGPARPIPLASWIAGGAGVALGVGGGISLALASSFNSRRETLTFDEAVTARATAQQQQLLGYGLAGAGAAAVITGAVLYFVLPPPPAKSQPVSFQLAPTAGGAFVQLSVTR